MAWQQKWLWKWVPCWDAPLPLDGLTSWSGGRREPPPKGLHHSAWDALVLVPKCHLLGSGGSGLNDLLPSPE